MPLQFCVESQWVTGRIQNRRGSLASQLSAPETINLLRKGELSPAVSPPGKKQALIPLNDSLRLLKNQLRVVFTFPR